MTVRLPVAMLAGIGFSLALAGGLTAQETGQEMGTVEQPTLPATGADYSDEKIAAFAVAYLRVAEIGQTFEAQLQAAPAEEQEALVQQATIEMSEAVDAAPGINVEEYNEILTTAQGDEGLAQRINTEIGALAAE